MSFQSAGETAVALYAFEPTEIDELRLSEGDVVVVLGRQEDQWWLVQKNELVGLIPSTYVAIRETVSGNGLPSGWDSCVDDESGDTFYINELTGTICRLLYHARRGL